MAYKIIVDASHGGNDTGLTKNNIIEKEYSLLISDYIYNRLKELGIDTKRTRIDDTTLNDEDRIKLINSLYTPSNQVIVLSNHLTSNNNGTEIIYALRNKNTLAEQISNQLESNNKSVNKYYQQRLPNDTSKDYFYITRETTPSETIIIEYDIASEPSNWKEYAEAVVQAIAIYTKTNYVPINNDNTYYTVKAGDTIFMGNNE